MFGLNWYILIVIITALLTYLYLIGYFLKDEQMGDNGALIQLAAVGPQDLYLTGGY